MTGLARGTLAALFALTLVAPVFAQFDPADGARKWRGDYESFHQGTAYHRQAQESSQMIYYSQLVQPAAPVAVITGDTDSVVLRHIHSDGLARDIKGASLQVIPDEGHAPHFGHAADVVGAVEDVELRSAAAQ